MSKEKPATELQKQLAVIWWLGVIVVTCTVAPYNPPTWSDGILYPVWWIAVLWVVMMVSMIPVGFVVIIAFKLFRNFLAMLLTLSDIWFFDYYMRSNFPMVMMTPLCAFSALYVFIVLKEGGYIKCE